MKAVLALLLITHALCDIASQKSKLEQLAKRLYEVEDKLDHLLFHYSHDVTKHEYQATPFGTFLAPVPKNPNSIHQKLKLTDYLNHQMGHPYSMKVAADNAYNMGMGVPGSAFGGPGPRGVSPVM